VTRRVLASTTSHKREPLLATLEVFARLGLCDLDLNLHHFLEMDASADGVADAVAARGQRVWVVSGGWCDFFHEAPGVEETMRSVDRQVHIGERLGARMLRLFFGRLSRAAYDPRHAEVIAGNLRQLSDRHADTTFVFENHDGASLVPEVCREILERVDRPNIRMNFDPINFARAGVEPVTAAATLQPFLAHMHLKGLDHGEFCEFGTGDVDVTPLLRHLVAQGYAGDFTVEYEGPFDGTLRLYQSVERARRFVASLD
jgi:sugar phosphate isomerase/epimerase